MRNQSVSSGKGLMITRSIPQAIALHAMCVQGPRWLAGKLIRQPAPCPCDICRMSYALAWRRRSITLRLQLSSVVLMPIPLTPFPLPTAPNTPCPAHPAASTRGMNAHVFVSPAVLLGPTPTAPPRLAVPVGASTWCCRWGRQRAHAQFSGPYSHDTGSLPHVLCAWDKNQ